MFQIWFAQIVKVTALRVVMLLIAKFVQQVTFTQIQSAPPVELDARLARVAQVVKRVLQGIVGMLCRAVAKETLEVQIVLWLYCVRYSDCCYL